MSKPRFRDLPDLTERATPGAEIAVRATPRAARNRLVQDADGSLRAYVTAVPESGKANAAIRALMAAALGVAKSDLTLVRGQSARDKVFRYDAAGGSPSGRR